MELIFKLDGDDGGIKEQQRHNQKRRVQQRRSGLRLSATVTPREAPDEYFTYEYFKNTHFQITRDDTKTTAA